MKRKLSAAIVAALATAAIAGGAYAAKGAAENDALAIAGSKVGLAQAIAAAEQHVGGKAAKAEFEQSKGQWVFDVEVVKDARVVMDVKVDATTGKVLAATEDKADHDDQNDQD
jgi:uncharacterized membrane protein YkoI